jgi:hypothetical protein
VERLESRCFTRWRRTRVFLGLVLCLGLFCAGLSVVDTGIKDMLGKGSDRPIFGVYGLDEQVIRLEFAGSEVSIDKSEWSKAYETIKVRLAKLIGR